MPCVRNFMLSRNNDTSWPYTAISVPCDFGSVLFLGLPMKHEKSLQILGPEFMNPGGAKYILGMGMCHQEGYRFSQFWNKELYQFS